MRFSPTKVLFFGLLSGLSVGLLGGLDVGLNIGLSIGLLFGLSVVLLGGLSFYESEVEDKQLPNQAIKSSVKTSLLVGLSIGLSFMLGGGLGSGLSGGLSGGLSVGLSVGLLSGYGVIQHVVLRFILYQSGRSPWNFEKFLEHAENHRFIQRVGGRYRFVHDLLRKQFAKQYH